MTVSWERIPDSAWPLLAAARASYGTQAEQTYDEVLREVAARIAATGSIGKTDIGALVLWKRIRADTLWARRLGDTPDEQVRAATAAAVAAVTADRLPVADAGRQGCAELRSLPGFGHGPALASALLTAAAPDRMAVYDRRAVAGLSRVGLDLDSGPDLYGRYLERVEALRALAAEHGADWRARDVDVALFHLGGYQ
ncbi:hypothetical protein B0I33_1019 [Prauserella shujinwangii]|uniref:Uncharacterized protein n=1 Tax=Prauserella shujinwangii TaxID=1453103 RepID=A0A2T0M278_9PSEU|nr:hypothetical protein [Prauserella shujinwangii]PRX50858.1 hypothetical protein B0I33_1019 [Prauserella shujinwangii]